METPPTQTVDVFEAKPNRLFSPAQTAQVRFLRYPESVPCAECGRKSRHHWTMLVPFTAQRFAVFVLATSGRTYAPMTPVCRAHPLGRAEAPRETVLAAMAAYRRTHAITDDDRIEIAVPGEDLWRDMCRSPDILGNPEASVIALRFEGFGAFYSSAAAAIADLDSYYQGY